MDKVNVPSELAKMAAGLAAALCLWSLSFNAYAAPAELGGSSSTEITSEKVVYVGDNNQVEFQGDVHVTRDEFELWCQRLEVFLSPEGDSAQPSASDSQQVQGTGRIEKIMAYDDVRIEMQARTARSDQAEYRADDEKLFLRGNVLLSEGKNQIQGEQVVFDLRQNTSQVTAGESGKVKALFFPDKSEEEPE